jgi:hypothetical protein
MRGGRRTSAGLAALLLVPFTGPLSPPWGRTHSSEGKKVEAPQSSLASSLGLMVYPSREPGTPREQEDQGECYLSASAETGVDPLGIGQEEPNPADVAQGQTEAQGRVSKGLGAGALLGVSLGRAWRGTGKRGLVGSSSVGRAPVARTPIGGGGMVGGSMGVLVGGSKEQGQQNAEESEAAQEAQPHTQERGTFASRFSACLEDRGYVVK